jgi:ribonucleoside-diphosphate reductase alpha chain
MKPVLTENALTVLEKRYFLRDESGCPCEDAEGLFRRVANTIAEGDLKYGKTRQAVNAFADQFYALMARLEFLPNSPTLMNAGKPDGQLSACFVLPVEDNLNGIFETLKQAALIHQSGGGTGFSFSRLRPQGDRLRFTSGVTSGPISFMEVYNAATEAIKQGGTRRGANMGILRIDHPDIEAFITLKNDLSRMTNFNLSVAVTDAFMAAVKTDTMFPLIHPKTRQVVREIHAKVLMQRIVDSAWKTGEPGLIFIDRINAENPTPGVGDMEATNPCGEVPLLPYEACNLGSINLGKMLNPTASGGFEVDWEHFRSVIALGVHFLDNVITQNRFPLDEIRQMVEGNRKIGLGLMGWADTLMMLGIPYDSPEAIAMAERVMTFMNYHAKRASMVLAKERGRFPFFDRSIFVRSDWVDRYAHAATEDWQGLALEIKTHGLRNATTLCLAPTGTISIIAGASGGIEPLYALAFVRTIMDQTRLMEINPFFERTLKARSLYSDRLMQQISERGSIRGLTEIPADLQSLFVTAYDILPEWHVRMQQVFQQQSDNAVSKTINFPESASRSEIEKTYMLAYELGLKGITVYRDNCRDLQPMGLQKSEKITLTGLDSLHCPECKKPLQLIEGCMQCTDCQYAYCG